MTKILELQLQHQSFQSIFRVALQRIFRRLRQHHISKVCFLHSAFFMVQLSQLYVTTGKTIALTIWTFVDRIMSVIFYTLFKFVIIFMPKKLVKPSFTLWQIIICEEKFSWLCKDSKNTLFIVWVESYYSLS